jgi:DNA-binding CsgD family transcriptional regulator
MTVQMQAFSQTIEAIYEAGPNPERWPHALERIGDYFGAEGSVILFYESRETPHFIYPERLAAAVGVYLEERWWERDLHAQRAIALNLGGFEVMSDQTVASDSEIRTHPIYTDFFRRVGFGWLMSCLILPDRHDLVVLSVPKAKAKGPFTLEEMHTLGLLGRHVEQALRISLRLSSLVSMETALKQALDAVDAGMHTLGADGRLLFSNRAGRLQFDAYFEERDGCLIAKVAEEREKLHDYLASARQLSAECGAPRSCVLIGRGGTRLVLWAMPVGHVPYTQSGQRSTAAMLLLATPMERDMQVDPAVLRDCMHLTISEARLASLVGAGVPIEQVADQLGITVGTARNVLKAVFRKAGVNRQAQLAAKIANLGRIAFEE